MEDTLHSRYMFDNILSDLGLDKINYSVMFDPTEEELDYSTPEGSISIVVKLRPFVDKLNYLYFDYLHRHYMRLPEDLTKRKIVEFLEKTKFQPDNLDIQVCEVGWYISGYSKPIEEFETRNRKRVLFKIIKDIKHDLEHGVWMIYPKPNLILTAYPYGKKIDQHDEELAWEKGKHNRMTFAKRLGFGDIQEDGMMYAKYNEDYKLEPLN